MTRAIGSARDRAAERLRLLQELDRLERAQREVDLRDSRALETLRLGLEALRRQIATLDKSDEA